MQIQIFLTEKIGVPFQEFKPDENKFKLTWEGTTSDLDIHKILDDTDILEIIFDKFNLNRRPKSYPDDERALSIGDIVCIDYRAYLCDTMSWKRLENFNLALNA